MECPKCKKPLTVASGIGPYCANENCPVLDDYRLWERKVLLPERKMSRG